jgi:hypothetical protein
MFLLQLLSASFTENVLLLLVTAVLTGLLVPLVKGYMDDKKYRQQKQFEAQLARQTKVIESQVALLESMSQLLWQFHMSYLEVSYYAKAGNIKRYDAALSEYDRKSWEYFIKIGAEIGKAQRLTSDSTYQKLKEFFDDWVRVVDNDIARLAATKAKQDVWAKHHDRAYIEGGRKIDEVLTILTKEFLLEGGQSKDSSDAAGRRRGKLALLRSKT